jgi:excisionase family DNA binding protein
VSPNGRLARTEAESAAQSRPVARETKLALRDELPAIIREHLRPLLEGRETSADRGEALSTMAAAAYVGVSPATVREWASSGQLRAKRAGRLLRVRRSDLDAFLTRSAPRAGASST